ncbi:MAG: hypothetical protein V1778_00870 [bacterium]
MKIYFYTPETRSAQTAENIRLLLDILSRSGVEVITKEQPVEQAFPDIYRQVERRGESFLDYVDAIVIEGSEADSEVGYLLAYAIAQKMPVMLLLRKGATSRNPLATFGQRLPKQFTLCYYRPETVEDRVVSFLRQLGDIEYQEVPSIKFTLRITPQIEQYLSWKTHNTKITKADFLRKLILDDVIANDAAFQQLRRKRQPSPRRT